MVGDRLARGCPFGGGESLACVKAEHWICILFISPQLASRFSDRFGGEGGAAALLAGFSFSYSSTPRPTGRSVPLSFPLALFSSPSRGRCAIIPCVLEDRLVGKPAPS